MSASVVGQPANFLFYLIAGANYVCLIDYGDGGNDTLTDMVYNFNNTFITHTFTKENIYVVSISCTNPASSLVLIFNHSAEYMLTGLQLSSNGTQLNTAYTIGFTLKTGSSPINMTFLIDGSSDPGFMYTNLTGKSSVRPGESTPVIHQVYIYMCNHVSCAQLNGTFEISSPIGSPSFNIVPSGNILTGSTYLFSSLLVFQISMKTGSNINILFNTDSSNPYSTLANRIVQIQTVGDWINNINDLLNK